MRLNAIKLSRANTSVILLVGTRKAESSHRAKHMNKRILSERGLNQHPEVQNTLVLQTIADYFHWHKENVFKSLGT